MNQGIEPIFQNKVQQYSVEVDIACNSQSYDFLSSSTRQQLNEDIQVKNEEPTNDSNLKESIEIKDSGAKYMKYSVHLDFLTASSALYQGGQLPSIKEEITQSLTMTASSSIDETNILIPLTTQMLIGANYVDQKPTLLFPNEEDLKVQQIQYTIQSDRLQVLVDGESYRFMLNDSSLSHFQKYFFLCNNILLPIHCKQALESKQLHSQYFKLYFDHVIAHHKTNFIQYLKMKSKGNFNSSQHQNLFGQFQTFIENKIGEIYETVLVTVRKYSTNEKQNCFKRLITLIKHLQKLKQSNSKLEAAFNKLGVEEKEPITQGIHSKISARQEIKTVYCWVLWGNGFYEAIKQIKKLEDSKNQVLCQKIEQVIKNAKTLIKKQCQTNLKLMEKKIILSFTN